MYSLSRLWVDWAASWRGSYQLPPSPLHTPTLFLPGHQLLLQSGATSDVSRRKVMGSSVKIVAILRVNQGVVADVWRQRWRVKLFVFEAFALPFLFGPPCQPLPPPPPLLRVLPPPDQSASSPEGLHVFFSRFLSLRAVSSREGSSDRRTLNR